jgi:hypothetical protein
VGSLVESFLFKMAVDNAAFKRGMEDAAAATDKTAQAAKKSSGILTETAKAFQSVAVTKGLLTFVQGSLQASAALENVGATSKQIFGDSADIIEKWAKNSVEAVGLSERAAVESASMIAALGKAAGIAGPQLAEFSTDMVGLAADMSQMFNTSVPDALAAIQSGLSGTSVEPLRRYGVIINDNALKTEYFNETGVKVNGTLTAQQRTVAFLSLLYKQTADSQGQWAREYDSLLATQQRFTAELENFKAAVGSALLEPATQVVSVLTGMLGAFQSVNAATDGMVAQFVALGAIAAILSPVHTRLTQGVKSLTASWKHGATASKLFTGGLIAAEVAMAVYAMHSASVQKANANIQKGFGDVANGAMKVGDALALMSFEANNADFITFPWEDGQERNAETLLKNFREIAATAPEVASRFLDVAEATKNSDEIFGAFGLSLDDMRAILNEAIIAQEKAKDATSDYNLVVAEATGTIVRNEAAIKDWSKALSEVEKAAKEAKAEVKELLDAASQQFVGDWDPFIAELELTNTLNERLEIEKALTEAKDDQVEIDKLSLDLVNNSKAIREGILGIVEAEIAAIEDKNNAELTGKDLIDAQIASLERLKASRPDLAADIDAAIAEIQEREVNLTVAATIAEGDLTKLQTMIQDQDFTAQVLLEYLIGAGLTEQEANDALDSIPAEKQVKILLDASEVANAEGKLSDEDFVADVVLEGVTEELDAKVAEYEDVPGGIFFNPELGRVTTALEALRRREQNKPILIPVTINTGRRAGTTTSPVDGQTRGLLGAETGETLINGTPQRVVAGVPTGGTVVNQYITMPPGMSDSDVAAAAQRWTRRNGSLFSLVT